MTTIRGKGELEIEFRPTVSASFWGDTRIDFKGHISDGKRTVPWHASMSMNCTAQLVRDIRAAMRRARDEKIKSLNKAVEEAEGPLP